MNRAVQFGTCVGVAIIIFLVGFVAGRFTHTASGYDTKASAVETPLVGQWKISSNTAPKLSAIEFRDNRTAVKYKDDGEPGIVAVWGRIGDELSIQNAHVTGEEHFYVPPSLFKVLKIDDQRIHLVTVDGETTWELTRL